jgi:hypothetical protein
MGRVVRVQTSAAVLLFGGLSLAACGSDTSDNNGPPSEPWSPLEHLDCTAQPYLICKDFALTVAHRTAYVCGGGAVELYEALDARLGCNSSTVQIRDCEALADQCYAWIERSGCDVLQDEASYPAECRSQVQISGTP